MRLEELWRYPVKSMAGERLDSAILRIDGIEGDRVVHAESRAGRVLTARRHPRLLGHRAVLGPDGEPLVDGRPWDSPASPTSSSFPHREFPKQSRRPFLTNPPDDVLLDPPRRDRFRVACGFRNGPRPRLRR